MYRALRDGGVETVDTVTAGTRIVDLTPLLYIAPVHGVTGAIFDGCLLNQAVFVPAARLVYSVVPATATTLDDGTTDYRVVGMTVPSLRPGRPIKNLTAQTAVPRIGVTGAGYDRYASADEIVLHHDRLACARGGGGGHE